MQSPILRQFYRLKSLPELFYHSDIYKDYSIAKSRSPRTMADFETKILPVHTNTFRYESRDASLKPLEFIESPNIPSPSKDLFTYESDLSSLRQAAELLKNDEVVAMPTETVYGLAANALSPNAISKIFHAKSRPSDNPLIIHISSLHMLKSLLPGGKIPPSYLPLIQRFWPGPLTLLFPKSDSIPNIITASQPTVAIRFPSHPITRTLISLCGFPLAAPSANSSGKPSPTLAQHVYEDLKFKIPLIIDGGQCNYGIESTVLDGLKDPPVILRPGGVTAEMVKEIPGYEHVRVYKKDFVDRQMEETPTTPGMKYRHYSPEAEVILVNLNFDRSRPSDYEHALMKQKSVLEKELKIVSAKPNVKIGILKTHKYQLALPTSPITCDFVVYDTYHPPPIGNDFGNGTKFDDGDSEESSSVIARELFKGLRWLDSQKVDLLFIQGVEESDEGLAIMNRVRKAASKVIY